MADTRCGPPPTACEDDPMIEVTLLGTGSPIPDPNRAGPSTLVRARGQVLLVDCGRGVLQRAAASVWVPPDCRRAGGTVAGAGRERIRRANRAWRRPAPRRGPGPDVTQPQPCAWRISLRRSGNRAPAAASQTSAETRAIGKITPSSGQIKTNVANSASAAIAKPIQASVLGVSPKIRLGTAIPATSNPNATMCPGPPTRNAK